MSSIIFIDVFKDKETGAIPSLAELITRNLPKNGEKPLALAMGM